MATIQARTASDGSPRYRVIVRLKGHPVQTRTFRRKTDARHWAEEREADLRRGLNLSQPEAQRPLSRAAELYAEEVLPRLSPSDGRNRVRQLEWWIDQLGDLKLSEVRPSMVAAARDRLAKTGKTGRGPVTPATQNRYLAALSALYSWAIKDKHWLEDNPVRKLRRRKESRGRVRFLAEDEQRRLLDACKESDDPRLYLLVLLAISTGMRQGELLSLRWPDLDLNQRRDRGLAIVHDTKNGDRRAVPLAGPALLALREHSRSRRLGTDLVFANERGNALWPKRPWERALDQSGIEDFRFHDTRHTAASYLLMSGCTLPELAKILGHRTIQMVMRYAHLEEQHTARVVGRMTEQFIHPG